MHNIGLIISTFAFKGQFFLMIFWQCIIISKYSIVILFSLLSEFNWLKLWKIDEEQIGNYIHILFMLAITGPTTNS